MSRLQIRHETTYDYDRPVKFKAWRLIMRPIDSHALRVIDARLELTPPGATRYALDAYGNSNCIFEPQGQSNRLSVVNHLLIDRFPNPLPDPEREDPRSMTPVRYGASDEVVLDPFVRPAVKDDDKAFKTWVKRWASKRGVLALDVLREMTGAIHAEHSYAARQEVGTQAASKTLKLGQGTCRDFAWLMIETARRLGFAARFVTGYLYSPNGANQGAGATHAWCEVFLPRLGWLEFDPTNGLVESHDLIRVAATRTPEEASPMKGEIVGKAASRMTVLVNVSQADGLNVAAA